MQQLLKVQEVRIASLQWFFRPQLLVTYSRSKELSAEAFMQGDEAGEEGSGSGRSYPEDYDSEGSGDDGSGDHEGRKYLVIQVTIFGLK